MKLAAMITNRKYKWDSRRLEFRGYVNDDMWLDHSVSLAFCLQVLHYSCVYHIRAPPLTAAVDLNPTSKVEFAERNSVLVHRVTFTYFFAMYVRILHIMRTAVAQCLRCCATNRKVAGSIPDVAIWIFHWHNPSARTMALGVYSACNRNEYHEHFLGVKSGRCVRLTTLPPFWLLSRDLGTLTSWNLLGTSGL